MISSSTSIASEIPPSQTPIYHRRNQSNLELGGERAGSAGITKKAVLSKENVKVLYRVLVCFSKWTNTLYLKWSHDKISLSTRTISQSCFSLAEFSSLFFQSFDTDLPSSSSSSSSSSSASSFKVSLVSLLPIFRQLKASVDSNFEYCCLKIDEVDNHLIIESSTPSGVRKRHQLFYEEEGNFLRANYQALETMENSWTLTADLLLDYLPFFEKKLDLITMEFGKQENPGKKTLKLKSDSASKIRTCVSVDCCEFDAFTSAASSEYSITISLLAFKTILQLAQFLKLSIDCHFSSTNSPFIILMSGIDYSLEFVLATIQMTDDDDSEPEVGSLTVNNNNEAEEEDDRDDWSEEEIPATPPSSSKKRVCS